MASEIPERIGKYTIEDLIGSGGMGRVYRGTDPETGDAVAVKVLTAGLAREEGFVERFNREIEAMRKLSHPSIVRLYDYGVDGENYFFAMEYVGGETLLGLLRRVRRLPWRQAFDIATEICQALKAAHDHGVIHRDLKPSNLLMDPAGHVHLTDFGVAQVFDTQRLTVTGGVIGTAEYMSPEQAEGKRATRQSDLYSLGVVLYVMVTGRTPFNGNSTVEVMQKHRFGLFDRPRSVVPELPARVDDTICRLLEKDPQKRFRDAFVLLRHLQTVRKTEDMLVQGMTISENASVESSATTSVAEPAASLPSRPTESPGQATLMKGLLRAELEEQQRAHPLVEWLSSLPMLLVLLAGLGAGVWWLWPRPPSDEQLFEQGVRLMGQGPGLNYLQARKESFQPLLERDRATWQDRISPYLREIELYELQRASRRPRTAAGQAPTAESGEDEPRRLLRQALEDRQRGDAPRAQRILGNLQRLLRDDPDREAVREMVDRLLDEVREDRQLETARAYAEETIARANQISRDGQPQAAAELLQALRELYREFPAIESQIQAAETTLGSPPAESNSPTP